MITWFWKALAAFSDEQRISFLKFASATERLPPPDNWPTNVRLLIRPPMIPAPRSARGRGGEGEREGEGGAMGGLLAALGGRRRATMPSAAQFTVSLRMNQVIVSIRMNQATASVQFAVGYEKNLRRAKRKRKQRTCNQQLKTMKETKGPNPPDQQKYQTQSPRAVRLPPVFHPVLGFHRTVTRFSR